MGKGIVGAGILKIITESLYDKPIVVFREYVQNAADSFFKSMNCGIVKDDLFCKIWHENECLFFLDNGNGIIEDQFQEEMRHIAYSQKKRTLNIGYKGIGRLSGISYCERLIFVNVVSYEEEKYQEYVIECQKYNELKKQDDYSELGFEELMDQIGTYYDQDTCSDVKKISRLLFRYKEILKKKNIFLNSGFSIAMPDNYVVLFDVMSKEQQTEKLDKADKIIYKIAKMIALQKNNFFRVEKGKFPLLKSTLLHYLFHHFYTNTKHFYTTGDCIGCGKCEALCPTHIIHMKSEKPYWDKGNCYMCLACLNYCPKEAIQYTKKTEKHGRYHNTRL